LLLVLAAPVMAKDLRVGTCRREITPVSSGLAAAYEARFGTPAVVNHSDPVWMAGFGNGRSALDYHDRLWARGVVIDGKGGRIAIVTLDLIGYFTNEIATIRAMVSPESAVDYVVVTSTHQHEGPDTLGLWGPDELTTGIDYGYLDFVNAAAADCVDEAAANLVRARVRFATTTSEGLSLGLDPEDDGLGVADGKVLTGDAALAPDTEGRIVDPTIATMQFSSRDTAHVLATLVNFGSHPESLGSANRLITADFPNAARQRLEAEYGGLAIWVSGDLGVLQGPLDIDVLDPDTGQPAPRRTFRFAEVHGTQLAERAIAALSGAGTGQPAPKIRFASVNPVMVRLDNPFFRLFAAIGVLNVRRPLYTDGVPDSSVGFPVSAALRCHSAGARRGHPDRGGGAPHRRGEHRPRPDRARPPDRLRLPRPHGRRDPHIHLRPRERSHWLPGAVREVGSELPPVRAVRDRGRRGALPGAADRLQHGLR
jgi:hypothetical protein